MEITFKQCGAHERHLVFSWEVMKGGTFIIIFSFAITYFFNINPCVYKPYTENIFYISLIDENNDFTGSEIADPGRGPSTIQESPLQESW
jgi:hypothetical protein